MTAYQLNKAVYELSRREDRRSIVQTGGAFFDRYDLSARERRALTEPNFAALRDLELLPNLLYRYYIIHGLSPSQFRERMQQDAERYAAEPEAEK